MARPPADRSIDKVYRKFHIDHQPSDLAYWKTQPYEKRLAALEAIRKEYHGGNDAPEQGLQRVYRIVKR
jgi:hypothetical protein